MSSQLVHITTGIPMLLTYNSDEGMPVKNVPIFDFQDALTDYGRLFGYLKTLPAKERNRKIKKFEKIFPEIDFR